MPSLLPLRVASNLEPDAGVDVDEDGDGRHDGRYWVALDPLAQETPWHPAQAEVEHQGVSPGPPDGDGMTDSA